MFPVQKYVKQFSQFCIVNGAFSSEEVDKILDIEDLEQFQKGRIANNKLSEKARDSDVMWITPQTNGAEWLFHKFSHLVSMVNYDHFMSDISHFDAFQYTKYNSKGQHYNWHLDSGGTYNNFERKISASIMLTDPNDYEGGEFYAVINGQVDDPVIVKPEKGDVIFFSSWTPHKVAPVTSGVRKSLVVWVMGPL
jgi:PKHD-type hydroxylase